MSSYLHMLAVTHMPPCPHMQNKSKCNLKEGTKAHVPHKTVTPLKKDDVCRVKALRTAAIHPNARCSGELSVF